MATSRISGYTLCRDCLWRAVMRCGGIANGERSQDVMESLFASGKKIALGFTLASGCEMRWER